METVGALAAVVAGDSVADGVGPAPDPGPDLGTGRGDPPAGSHYSTIFPQEII